jgi:hypothetical protein
LLLLWLWWLWWLQWWLWWLWWLWWWLLQRLCWLLPSLLCMLLPCDPHSHPDLLLSLWWWLLWWWLLWLWLWEGLLPAEVLLPEEVWLPEAVLLLGGCQLGALVAILLYDIYPSFYVCSTFFLVLDSVPVSGVSSLSI